MHISAALIIHIDDLSNNSIQKSVSYVFECIEAVQTELLTVLELDNLSAFSVKRIEHFLQCVYQEVFNYTLSKFNNPSIPYTNIIFRRGLDYSVLKDYAHIYFESSTTLNKGKLISSNTFEAE